MNNNFKDIFKIFSAITIALIIGIYILYQDSKIARKPIDFPKWKDEVNNLKIELENLKIPLKTTSNDLEDTSKSGTSIFLKINYKTELPENQFFSEIRKELKDHNFELVERENNRYSFCRGKVEAVLYYQGKGGIFSDNSDKYILMFIKSFDRIEAVSNICK